MLSCKSQIKSLWRTGLKLIRMTPLHVTLEEEGIEEGFIAAWTLNGKQMKSFIILCLFQYRSKSQNKKTCKQVHSSGFERILYSMIKYHLFSNYYSISLASKQKHLLRSGRYLGVSYSWSISPHAACFTHIPSYILLQLSVCLHIHCFSDCRRDHVTRYASRISK